MATRWLPALDHGAISGVEVSKSELGKGSDATVYSGVWYGARVAVKILHRALVDPNNTQEGTRALLERFRQECGRLQLLRHPNIVQFLGVIRIDDGRPALVTELLRCSLLHRYQSKPALSLAQSVRLLRDGAAGLSYLHSLSIIHRDITTRNVLVTNDGRAKLADVGLARYAHLAGDNPTQRMYMTEVPGTVLYMAPETFTTRPIYNVEVDVFSYGVLMLALLLCREPAAELLYSPRTQLVDGETQVIPEVARRAGDLRELGFQHALYFVVVRCLQNSPNQRPTSDDLFAQLSNAVQAYAAAEEIDDVQVRLVQQKIKTK